MKINIGKILGVGLKILPHIGTAMEAVEALKGDAKGPEKEDAAVDLAKLTVKQIEANVEADLLDDELVEGAVREVMRAVKKLTNVVKDARERRAKTTPILTGLGDDPRTGSGSPR